MIRSFKYRIYPTAKQSSVLNEQLGAACDIYNAALQQRYDMWRDYRISISYFDQCRELTDVRTEDILPYGMSSQVQRDPLRRVDKAFKEFFGRCQSGKTPGFPRFKPKSRYSSLTWPGGKGAEIRDNRLRVMGVGSVRVCWHRSLPLDADIRLINIKRTNNRWYVTFVIRIDPVLLEATSQDIGVDRGVTVPFAFSTGQLCITKGLSTQTRIK